ncbi:glycosyl hydrolase 53 [Aureobasidium subglaciale]|nr:glycosyl hydrolase 53 [Aureobasidium subglaciale]
MGAGAWEILEMNHDEAICALITHFRTGHGGTTVPGRKIMQLVDVNIVPRKFSIRPHVLEAAGDWSNRDTVHIAEAYELLPHVRLALVSFNMPSLLSIASAALVCLSAANASPHQPVQTQVDPFFYKGFDLSSLHILELGNVTYKDTARHNATRPAEDILGDGGMNTVRLRIWVNPEPGQYDLAYTLSQAQRFAKKGYRIYLDFHFSDTWADPNKQFTPAAWTTSSVSALGSDLRRYVKSTLIAFQKGGVDLSLVSLGNEIRHGMLWPTGYVEVDTFPTSARIANFTSLASLWSNARKGVDDAVKAGVKKPSIMIHIDDGWNKTLQLNWFEALTGSGKVKAADWDVFGFSFYPFYGTAATLDNLKDTLNAVATKYQKPVHVVETDWPAICDGATAPELSDTSVPISPAGQTEWVRDIVSVVKNVAGGWGKGVNYWEPTWLNNTGLGSACQDAILFSADWSGWPNKIIGYSRSSVDMFAGR